MPETQRRAGAPPGIGAAAPGSPSTPRGGYVRLAPPAGSRPTAEIAPIEIVVFALAALSALLAIAAFAAPVARALGAPAPVAVTAIGLAWGLAISGLGLDVAGGQLDPYQLWFVQQLSLDSGAMLYIFLPPLLFEMALAIQVRRLAEDWAIVLLMAVLAVAAATLAVGVSVWLASGVGLIAAMMLGAAVATTDPAAVVTTFREIGAQRRLLNVLEGESLLNDAAAIAIFSVLLVAAHAGPEALTPAALAGGFLFQFGVGAAIGLLAGAGASRLYPLLGGSAASETSLTLALAYGVYIGADQAGASGVVAVVFAGGVTGATGFVRMGPGNWRATRQVWAQIGWWCNALILLLVASLTPGLLLSLDLVTALMIPVVYVAAFAARAALLFGFLPPLERLGLAAPLDDRRKALVLWGGVRGAVTLVLALSLTEISALGEDAARVGAIAAGFTLLTLLVNAPTLAFVTGRLGLDRLSPGDMALRDRIVAGSYERVRRVIANLAAERALDAEAEAAVQANLAAQAREAVGMGDGSVDREHIPFGERLRLGLAILCGQESRLVRRAFEEGAIGPRATLHLRLAADRLADAARAGGREGYAAAAAAAIRPSPAFRIAVALQRRLRIDRPLRAAMELDFTALRETERNLRALDAFAEVDLAGMIGADAARNLRGALTDRLEDTRAAIEAHQALYPEYAAAHDRLMIARAALRRERTQFERLFADGVIGPELHRDLLRGVDRQERALGRPPRLDLAMSADALLDRVPLFAGLEPKLRRRLARRLKTRFTTPGEVIIPRGARGDAMFFVAFGAVEAQGEDEDDVAVLSAGDFFGEVALLAPTRRRRTEIVSLGFCRLLTLTRREFRRLADRAPALEAAVREAAMGQLSRGFARSRGDADGEGPGAAETTDKAAETKAGAETADGRS